MHQQTSRKLIPDTTSPKNYFTNNPSHSPHFFMIQRFVPSGPLKCSMQYQVFRNKHSSDEQFDLVNQIYKRVMSEDKYLCDLAQKNLNAGVFVNGELHPKYEKGPLFFQKVVRETVTEHYKKEQKAKEQIWPARQTPAVGKNAEQSSKDVDFCVGLSSGCSSTPEQLVW